MDFWKRVLVFSLNSLSYLFCLFATALLCFALTLMSLCNVFNSWDFWNFMTNFYLYCFNLSVTGFVPFIILQL